MERVLAIMAALLSACLLLLAVGVNKLPKPVPTAVIAEKPVGPVMGGQVATLLPASLTPKQHQVLNLAYKQAKKDGHRNPEIVQSVLLQETHAGGLKSYRVAGNKGDEYYGEGQLKVAAVRDVMKRWPELWEKYGFHTRTDQEIIAHLILDVKFNVEMTSKYLLLLQQQYGFTGRRLLNAYNRGPGGVRAVDDSEFHYAIGAERKLAAIKRGKQAQ